MRRLRLRPSCAAVNAIMYSPTKDIVGDDISISLYR